MEKIPKWKRWKLRNPEKWKDHQRKYYLKTKDVRNAKKRELYHKNKGNALTREECIERAQSGRNEASKKRAQIILQSGKKYCTLCGEEKTLSEFHPDPRCRYSLLQARCKQCQNRVMREHNLKMRRTRIERYGGVCKLCIRKITDDQKYAIHHISYIPEKKLLLCRDCHNTLHALRIYRKDLIVKFGSDMAPYEWAKIVVSLYENTK